MNMLELEKRKVELNTLATDLKIFGQAKTTQALYSALVLGEACNTAGQFRYMHRGTPFTFDIKAKKIAPGVYHIWLHDFEGAKSRYDYGRRVEEIVNAVKNAGCEQANRSLYYCDHLYLRDELRIYLTAIAGNYQKPSSQVIQITDNSNQEKYEFDIANMTGLQITQEINKFFGPKG